VKVRYSNLQDDFDPVSDTSLAGSAELADLLESRRRKLPFLAKLSGENGFELMIGIGRNVGCVQYSHSNGAPPYLMAISPNPPMKRGGFEFLTANTPTQIPAPNIVRFKELKEIALHFLETGERSNKVAWQEVGPVEKEILRGRWRPSERQHVLRLLGQLTRKRMVGVSFDGGAASAHQGVRCSNLRNSLDRVNGTIVADSDQLIELLERWRKSEPFVAELLGDHGFCLLLGIGSGIGFAQYRPVNGDLPYFMGLPAKRRVKRRRIEFLVNDIPTPIPARYILNFDEVRQIAQHFLRTGERNGAFAWESI
jgi:hypothetical protein